jgi:signal peptidase II
MNHSIRQSGLIWLWVTVVVIVLDQLTKILASSNLGLHESVAVMPFFNFTLAHNTGAAFSFLSNASGWQRWFFTLIALVISVAICVWLRRLTSSDRWMSVSLTLVLGGALGNLWDRLTLGYVIDFLDFYYGSWHWPAFNIADSAITVGAVMLVIDGLFFHKAGSTTQSEPK